jgi:hexosaminidase
MIWTLLLMATVAHALWPIPHSLQTGSFFLKLSPSFHITINFDDPPIDLVDAVARTKAYICTDKLQRLVVGRGANDSAAVALAPIPDSRFPSVAPRHLVLLLWRLFSR